jgi:alanine-glyoxylate transaminase/serine-glyoxylate transaminase/serine-pyruvate transaminase
VKELAAIARERGALTIVDTVTSLGGHDVDLAGWGVDVAYSCAQKCIGAPSGVAPLAISGAARERLVKCRSFYLDVKLLEDYWVGRKYHHTMCTSLIYALREALQMVEEEGLPARHARHERHHRALVAGVEAMGLSLLPPEGERLWTLNTIRTPAGLDEAAVRKTMLTTYNIEVGAGLGPLAGKIWRVGLMGASSTPQTLLQFLAALEAALAMHGHPVPEGAGVAAAGAALRPVVASA